MLADGTVITGGCPIRVLRLSPAGARHVAGWWAGTAVPGSAKARALARRLLDTGIAHPVLEGGPAEKPEVTVVIPVRDRHAELARCLAGLRASGGLGGDQGFVPPQGGSGGMGPPGREGASRAPQVIVVDDGSRDPAGIQSAAAAAGASVVRRPANGGPPADRNTRPAAGRAPPVGVPHSACVPRPRPPPSPDAPRPPLA